MKCFQTLLQKNYFSRDEEELNVIGQPPRLGVFWTTMIFAGSIVAPVLMVAGACAATLIADEWSRRTAYSMYIEIALCSAPLSISNLLLFIVSHPTNKSTRYVQLLKIYSYGWGMIFFLALGIANINGGRYALIIVSLIAVTPIYSGVIRFFHYMRLKLGTMASSEVNDYVVNSIFLQGIVGALPPQIFFP